MTAKILKSIAESLGAEYLRVFRDAKLMKILDRLFEGD